MGMQNSVLGMDVNLRHFPYTHTEGDSVGRALEGIKAANIHIIVAVLEMSSWTLLEAGVEAALMGGGHVWIGVGFDVRRYMSALPPAQLEMMRAAVAGSLLVQPTACIGLVGSCSQGWAALEERLTEGELPANLPPELREHAVAMGIGKGDSLSALSAYAYDAMWTVALGIAAMQDGNDGATVQERLATAVASVQFDGASGAVRFTETGDRHPATAQYAVSYLDRDGAWVPYGKLQSQTYDTSSEGAQGGVFAEIATTGNTIVWPGGQTAIPSDGSSCPQGTVFCPAAKRCVYFLGLLFPYTRSMSLAERVIGAYAAIAHVNSHNASIVPQAEQLPPEFRIAGKLFDTLFEPQGGIDTGIQAKTEGIIAGIGALRSSVTMPLSQILALAKTPVVSYGECLPRIDTSQNKNVK
jgi:hypothetical protein